MDTASRAEHSFH